MHFNRNKLVTMTLMIPMLFAFMIVGLNVNIAPASPQTTLYIDPTPITVSVCDNFTVDLNVADVTDLYAWEVKLSFNPSLLECSSATEGPFLKSVGPTIWVPPVIDNVAGTVHMACSLMMPPGATGSGTLAYIIFHCKGPGECDLVFLYPETYLLNSDLIVIPHESVNGHVVQWWAPQEILDVELYPREVVDLGDPTSTQWHELHPSKTNYYHLMSWEPGRVLSPEDQIDMYLIDPPVQIHVWTEFVDPILPICSIWHEIVPEPWEWHLTSWEDTNGDGFLSPCDQIDMTNLMTGDVVWFHVWDIFPPEPIPGPREMILDVKYWFQVDEVTVDMTLLPEVGEKIFVEYKCGYWTFDPKNPICTKWNQIDPKLGPVRCLHLTSWIDKGNGVLDPSDIIDMTPLYPTPGPVEYYQVVSMWISLKLTPKKSPPVVPPPPVGPMYLESMISYDRFDLSNPVCTMWHEIYPVYSRIWHLSSWENFLGLSPSDQIVLALKDEFGQPIPGTEAWYHVDKLTVAMNLTDMREITHIVKFEESLKEFKMYHWRYPVSTQWHEVNPEYCRQWHILAWEDNGDGYLGYCDLILMIDKHTGLEEWFHVESLSTDMWLTISHDIAVTDVKPLKPVVGQGYICPVNVTVTNEGYFTETFSLTLYAETMPPGTPIETIIVNNLLSGETRNVTFTWNTTGFAKGNYTISAYAWPVPGETDTADNRYIDGWVLVSKVGDLGGGLPPRFFACDGVVDGLDLALFVQCYRCTCPPEAKYLGDLGGGIPPKFFQCDGVVDGLDLALFVQCYRGLGPPDP